ncbi:hypothetical protein SAMN05421546_1614 [Solilutibacter tolerans]|uniref:S1/P1 Nuclease n=2 Tax=Solilutibacter tolerans TaxID=1604334 RepID=A0A1N6UBW2_9GAMM|nr:hypothetical protein SAMN05421546_1614 [Lysobacter tolerans]
MNNPMTPLLPRLALLLFMAAISLPAAAWGPQGHRLVARLADAELSPAARREINRLLIGEADPTLAGIANWADDIRDHDPVLYRRTARWHFVNLGEHGCEYIAKRDCKNGDCVVEAIRKQAAILKDRHQSLLARRNALKFIVHFVGDVHQPLHAGYARDRGGNDIQVNDTGFGTNLHAVWDSRMLFQQRLSDDAYIDALNAMPLAVALARDPIPPAAASWARDSCAIVMQPGFYPTRPRLDASYFPLWTPVADTQMRRAGARLAQLLNASLAR